MTTALSLFQTQVGYQVQATTGELPTVNLIEMIKGAVEEYSRDLPDFRVEDVTGTASRYYVLSTILDRWDEDFSRVIALEYPAAAIDSNETPVYLEPEDWIDDFWAEVSSAQTRHLYLPYHSPAATETLRVRYTLPYFWFAGSSTTAVAQSAHGFVVDDYVYLLSSTWFSTDDARAATHRVSVRDDLNNFTAAALVTDIPLPDFYAISNLASSLCCRIIASKYASASDTTIGADSTAHSTRSAEYAARATDFRKLYRGHMGLDVEDRTVQGSAEFVDFDTKPAWPQGRQFIYHGKEHQHGWIPRR